jgi:hypothetical protein
MTGVWRASVALCSSCSKQRTSVCALRLEALVLRGARPVVSECSDFDRFVVLELTRADYDAVRKAGRFIVAKGHCAPELEHVVERRDGFDIVEKEQAAA